jgi:hypothetical protein
MLDLDLWRILGRSTPTFRRAKRSQPATTSYLGSLRKMVVKNQFYHSYSRTSVIINGVNMIIQIIAVKLIIISSLDVEIVCHS